MADDSSPSTPQKESKKSKSSSRTNELGYTVKNTLDSFGLEGGRDHFEINHQKGIQLPLLCTDGPLTRRQFRSNESVGDLWKLDQTLVSLDLFTANNTR